MTQNLMSAGVLVLAAPILLLGVADLSIFVQWDGNQYSFPSYGLVQA